MEKRRIAITLLGALGLVAAVVAWNGEAKVLASQAPSKGAQSARRVTLATAEQRDVPLNIEVTGTVAPLHSVDIRPLITAVVDEIAVKDGQQVRKGDLLFTLRNDLVVAEREKAGAQLAREKVALADLERQLARAKDLQAQQFLSQSAVDAVETQLHTQRSALSAALAALRVADATVDRLRLHAPFDGKAGRVSVSVGSRVSETDSLPLVTLNQLDPVGVQFAVPVDQLQSLLLDGRQGVNLSGAKLTVAPQGSSHICSQAEATSGGLRGVVNFVDSAIDSTTGALRMRGTFTNPMNMLWPGQFVVVRVEVATLPAAIVIPQAALMHRGKDTMVFVHQRNSTVQLRKVQSLYSDGSTVVVEGVVPGESVVLEGKQDLVPGSLVEEVAVPGVGALPQHAKADCIPVRTAVEEISRRQGRGVRQ